MLDWLSYVEARAVLYSQELLRSNDKNGCVSILGEIKLINDIQDMIEIASLENRCGKWDWDCSGMCRGDSWMPSAKGREVSYGWFRKDRGRMKKYWGSWLDKNDATSANWEHNLR